MCVLWRILFYTNTCESLCVTQAVQKMKKKIRRRRCRWMMMKTVCVYKTNRTLADWEWCGEANVHKHRHRQLHNKRTVWMMDGDDDDDNRLAPCAHLFIQRAFGMLLPHWSVTFYRVLAWVNETKSARSWLQFHSEIIIIQPSVCDSFLNVLLLFTAVGMLVVRNTFNIANTGTLNNTKTVFDFWNIMFREYFTFFCSTKLVAVKGKANWDGNRKMRFSTFPHCNTVHNRVSRFSR